MSSIVELEQHLHRNGTRVVKVFLHLSKNEQRKRFLARIDEPDKNWKFSLSDIHERKYWKKYMEAYEDCLAATSTAQAPWYVVPSDDKENAKDGLSQDHRGTPAGIEVHPQASSVGLSPCQFDIAPFPCCPCARALTPSPVNSIEVMPSDARVCRARAKAKAWP